MPRCVIPSEFMFCYVVYVNVHLPVVACRRRGRERGCYVVLSYEVVAIYEKVWKLYLYRSISMVLVALLEIIELQFMETTLEV